MMQQNQKREQLSNVAIAINIGIKICRGIQKEEQDRERG